MLLETVKRRKDLGLATGERLGRLLWLLRKFMARKGVSQAPAAFNYLEVSEKAGPGVGGAGDRNRGKPLHSPGSKSPWDPWNLEETQGLCPRRLITISQEEERARQSPGKCTTHRRRDAAGFEQANDSNLLFPGLGLEAEKNRGI